MSVRSAQSITKVFTTRVFATGVATNADSTPTGTLYVNGTADAASVTVTNITTGVYKAAVTLPTLALNDTVDLRIAATVSTIADTAIIWHDTKDFFAGSVPDVIAGGSGGLFIAGSNAATTISGLTTGALSCTTITASGAVAFQSTFAVTTSTSLAALSASTVTFSGAVAFQSTFAITGTTTLTGAVTASNASNNIAGIDVAKFGGTAGTFTGGRPQVLPPTANVIVIPRTGLPVTYVGASDTAVARGNVLVTAIAAAPTYSAITLVGNFDIGTGRLSLPVGTKLDVTRATIIGACLLENGHPIELADDCEVFGGSVICPLSTTVYHAPIGVGSGGANRAYVHDMFLQGSSDVVYEFGWDGAITINTVYERCYFLSRWDTFARPYVLDDNDAPDAYVHIKHCTSRAIGGFTIAGAPQSPSGFRFGFGKFLVDGCYIDATETTGATSQAFPLQIQSISNVTVSGKIIGETTIVASSVTTPVDILVGLNATASVGELVKYNTGRTSGTIGRPGSTIASIFYRTLTKALGS